MPCAILSEEVRLLATLAEALAQRGVEQPAAALLAYRGIQTATVLVQPSGWSAAELAQVRAFAQAKRYDLVWVPDIQAEETNRFNQLPEVFLRYETMARDCSHGSQHQRVLDTASLNLVAHH